MRLSLVGTVAVILNRNRKYFLWYRNGLSFKFFKEYNATSNLTDSLILCTLLVNFDKEIFSLVNSENQKLEAKSKTDKLQKYVFQLNMFIDYHGIVLL